MAIKYYTLPIKPGYVEVEVDGKRTYRNIKTMQLIDDEILTPSKQRENAYNNDKIIPWESEMITVTEASLKWQYYSAEGSEKAQQLTNLIIEAKNKIREKYPDVD